MTTDPAKNIDGTTTVTGKTEPGNTVVVTDESGKEYPATVDADGNYTVDVPVDADGGKLTVKTTDTDGNSKSTEVDVAGTPALTTD
ncbi:Ig-like domain-containing protein, partial [Secundilactobacillus similis]|uniref:Ig-like domain-containing protein n=1 Tax=Secundilactobacillus similis TaxID=414682 RepID=UPI001CDB001C